MERKLVYDVVVVGGGTAGFAAAAGAAKCGVKTLLLERNPYLGGESTNSCIISYCGFFTRGEHPLPVVKGIGQEVLDKMTQLGHKPKMVISPTTGNASIRFSPEILKIAYDELADAYGFDVLLHTVVTGACTADNRITELICHDDEGEYSVIADSFVDATGDGNLAYLSGEDFEWGDEDGNVQLASLSVRVEGLPADADVSPDRLKTAILAAKADGDTVLQKEWGMILKINDEDTFGYYTIPSTEIHGLSAADLTVAEKSVRRQAIHYVEALRKYLPDMKNIRIASSGPSIGLRESRRIVCKSRITADDVFSIARLSDSVARGGWSPEVHKGANVRYTHINDYAYFDIPLDSLKPVKNTNLWCAGRCIGCDPIAHSSIRVMGTGFATGHAAGIAAALTSQNEFDIEKIRQELLKQNALI